MSQDDRRAIEYHAARHIWKRRGEQIPSGEGKTWEQWFFERFQKSLDEVAALYRKDQQK